MKNEDLLNKNINKENSNENEMEIEETKDQ